MNRYERLTSARRAGSILAIVCLASGAISAPALAAERPTNAFDETIAELCKRHGVPERLVHRVIMRESRYVQRALHLGNYGLMQIRYATARSMGYLGSAIGLLDGKTNLTYAIPYLANAWKVADHDEDRAVRLYASGFYYTAKQKGALSDMRTADSHPLAPPVAPPAAVAYASAPANPVASLFSALSPSPAPVEAASEPAVEPGPVTIARAPLPPPRPAGIGGPSSAQDEPAPDQVASAEPAADAEPAAAVILNAPLPPRRPQRFAAK